MHSLQQTVNPQNGVKNPKKELKKPVLGCVSGKKYCAAFYCQKKRGLG